MNAIAQYDAREDYRPEALAVGLADLMVRRFPPTQTTPSVVGMVMRLNALGWLINNIYQYDPRHETAPPFGSNGREWRVNLRHEKQPLFTKFFYDPTMHGALFSALKDVESGNASIELDHRVGQAVEALTEAVKAATKEIG